MPSSQKGAKQLGLHRPGMSRRPRMGRARYSVCGSGAGYAGALPRGKKEKQGIFLAAAVIYITAFFDLYIMLELVLIESPCS